MREVVVTGLGVISPAGIGKEALWETVSAGKSVTKSLGDITSSGLFGEFEFLSDAIAEVPGFTEHAWTLPLEVQKLDRYVQFAVAATLQAVEDAGLTPGSYAPGRTGISLSTAICGTPKMEEEFLAVTERGRSPIDPAKAGRDLYLASMSNTPGALLSAMLGAQGPCVTLSTGCIGGIDAIGNAFETIAYGDADVMVAGASEAPITPITVASFEIINCLSRAYRDRPETASRPYDAGRDGFVLGEACGVVILEEREHALRRGATPYMEINGFSHTSNAAHMTDLLSDGADLTRAMVQAVDRSGLRPADITHVSSHGSSTPQNDTCETSALKLALGERAREVPVNSAKSMLGHALAAASAVEIVLCALACERGFVHPTANYETPDPSCDLDYVPYGGRPWDGGAILKDASGFAGLHAAMVARSPRAASGEEAA
ncbi:beta-ketoacyl-[acyl-carrier-protein] synthase family protein [Streptomyces sp. HC44]|uniref:Beta-ketoacyl-[acyl-carrier-protein] synthase family protein n=1 Tax=Streptomyces scabichelini TaxID=2711217 RepID=A0A6G4VB68_9ACTN|nr:beta-ketoacyl-[acyl-carrier-protein] synthase family protein [Streptomyces scabichelini]NGO11145.1 beta-ketoacyl-[acyl-carrier-protein] synthase family protein [Streptomyces scabichelini]